MPVKTIEELEKSLDQKLEALAQDVEKKAVDKIREETRSWIEDLRKTRSFTTGAGEESKDRFAGMEPFYDLVGKAQIADMSKVIENGLSPKFACGIAGWAKAVFMREHGLTLPDGVAKALGEATSSAGGFLVPIEFKPELLRLIIEGQVVRPRALVIPMQTETLVIPRINDTTHASSIHGGIKGTWTAEAATLGTGDPAFGQIKLSPHKFTDYIAVSNELIMDSPIAIMPLLGALLREGLAFFEDDAFINGLGAGNPLGFLAATNGAKIAVSRTTTSHIVYDDVIKMYARMFPSSLNRAVWVCSPACFPELATMSVSVGTGGGPVWIQNAVGGPPTSILGRPLITSEKVPTLASAGDLSFVDFGYYIIGDRMQMAIATSEHVAFTTDQTYIRIIERLDGQPWINSALTPKNGGDTLSAFVTLAA